MYKKSGLLSIFVAVVSALWMLVIVCSAQAPGDGKIRNGVFESSYFKLSYRYPPLLQPIDINTLNLPKASALNNEFLVFSARQGAEPFGVVVIAEKLGVGQKPITGSIDFLSRIQRSWKPGEVTDIRWGKIATPLGVTFDTVEYRLPAGEFDCGVAARIGEYILVFKFNAKSEEDLKQMMASIKTISKLS